MKLLDGEFITQKRKEKKLSRENLAEMVGVSTQTICNWENEVTSIKLENLSALAGALELTEQEILERAFQKEKDKEAEIEKLNKNRIRVLFKNPGESPEVLYVADHKELNKLLGNVDKAGEGYDWVGCDTRKGIGDGMDMHMNEFSTMELELGFNIYGTPEGAGMIFGPVAIVGYDRTSGAPYGIVSLTDEQLEKARLHLIWCGK